MVTNEFAPVSLLFVHELRTDGSTELTGFRPNWEAPRGARDPRDAANDEVAYGAELLALLMDDALNAGFGLVPNRPLGPGESPSDGRVGVFL